MLIRMHMWIYIIKVKMASTLMIVRDVRLIYMVISFMSGKVNLQRHPPRSQSPQPCLPAPS